MLLGKGPFDTERKNSFLNFPLVRNFVGQKEVLCDLLRNGRGPNRTAPGPQINHVGNSRTQDRCEINTRMSPKVLILGRDKGINNLVRDGGDRNKHTFFTGVFRNQCTIGGMDTCHDLRLIVFKLGIVRQILTIVPENPGNTGYPGNRHQKEKAEDNR